MRIVVALGGNALGSTPEEQKNIVVGTAAALADLVEAGNELVVTHGNGPQVGMINLAFDTSANSVEQTPAMDFPECGAMSQGYIGYHLQNALGTELKRRNICKTVVTLITQVVVEENDKAFLNPTKPIGAFYTKEKAEELKSQKGYIITEIANRGFRRVVPSPKPIDIVEKEAVTALLNNGSVVITVGGGGIPVIKKGDILEGVAAVIDKDFASAKIAELINADKLIILTEVDKVAIDFGKPSQRNLDTLTVTEAEEYIKQDQFGKGSMLPKVQAAIDFVKRSGHQAIIAALTNVKNAIDGKSGTVIK
ncbi:MAG: carbamate kinase [Clostridia bacterium]